MYLVAPNYQAGKDSLAGFKRMFKGQVVGENYTKLGQLDYAAELAEIRAAKPQARLHLPARRHGHQLHQAVRRRRPGQGHHAAAARLQRRPGRDQAGGRRDGRPVQHRALVAGLQQRRPNQKFMAEFQKEYGACPTLYASQGYDAALLINAAVRDVKGKLEDRDAVRKALQAAKFDSVRGPFKFNTNQYPIQNYYVRVVGNDPHSGGLINKSFGEPILRDHGDAYVQDCKMKN